MSNDVNSEPAIDTAPAYRPATATTIPVGAGLRPNPVGTTGLVAAGLLTVAHVAFQLVTMNAILAGGALSANILVTLVQPAVMGVLVVVTVVLGVIGAFQRGRVRLAAGIALGVGAYALVSLITGVVVGVGYAMG
jgi:hypothetical protein